MPFKIGIHPGEVNNDDIFEIINNFDPVKDSSSEFIESPINSDIFLNYSIDELKTDDWKADGMLWENRGQKVINQKTDSFYRVLYHLKIGVGKSTNIFTKKVFRIPNTMSPTIVWYEGDDKKFMLRYHMAIVATQIRFLIALNHQILPK